MSRKSLVVVLLSLTAIAAAAPQLAKPKSQAARDALTKHDKAVKAAEKAYRDALKSAKQDLIIDLRAALSAAMQASDLPEANSIDAQIKAAEEEIKSLTAASAAAAKPNRTVFVLDASGSMIDHSTEAKQEITNAISQLSDGQMFTIVVVTADKIQRWNERWVAADEEGKRAAFTYLNKITVSGRGDAADGVLNALTLSPSPTTVVVVTNGESKDWAKKAQMIRSRNSLPRAAINTSLAITTNIPNPQRDEYRKRLYELAQKNNGVCTDEKGQPLTQAP